MRDALQACFTGLGHQCEVAADAAAALGLVERVSLDAIISDVRMGDLSGLDLLDRVKRTHPALPVVLITGLGGVAGAVEAMKRGAFQYMTKPCDLDELRTIVAGAIEERRRSEDAGAEPPALSSLSLAPAPGQELIGSGHAMRALAQTLRLVAASSAPVVIAGETGAGKELVAHAIHAWGPRRSKPFVAVNTSAIPSELLESEIFGHVRGGFTGAVQARKGLLVEADQGTLLLDEIGDMPSALQAKLLRVLQFGDVRPVGGDRGRQVDVRIIAATHRDLPTLVREGRFREDLYFRLNVLPVFVPPLRDRREDIPALVAHLLVEARRRAPDSPVRSIAPEALLALAQAPWPGNVRELASVIERAVVFGSGEIVGPEGLALPGASDPVPTAFPWSFPSGPPSTLRDLNRDYTSWVLARTGGNKEQAAQILGIDVSTLYRWQRAKRD